MADPDKLTTNLEAQDNTAKAFASAASNYQKLQQAASAFAKNAITAGKQATAPLLRGAPANWRRASIEAICVRPKFICTGDGPTRFGLKRKKRGLLCAAG